jgi:hypothetical protein
VVTDGFAYGAALRLWPPIDNLRDSFADLTSPAASFPEIRATVLEYVAGLGRCRWSTTHVISRASILHGGWTVSNAPRVIHFCAGCSIRCCLPAALRALSEAIWYVTGLVYAPCYAIHNPCLFQEMHEFMEPFLADPSQAVWSCDCLQ